MFWRSGKFSEQTLSPTKKVEMYSKCIQENTEQDFQNKGYWFSDDLDKPLFPSTTVPTPLEVSNLRSFGSSTVDTGAFDTRRLAIIIRNLLNLLSQLPGWRKHQTLAKTNNSVEGFTCWLPVSVRYWDSVQLSNTFGICTHNRTISPLKVGLVVDMYNSRKKILQDTK